MRVVAVVPARNEQQRVGDTVRALIAAGIAEVIVVDDASLDATAARASEAGAHVVSLRVRAGKGGAVAAGLSHIDASADTDATVIALVDADLGASASMVGDLVARVISGEADLVVGAPPRAGRSGFGLVEGAARLGIRALSGRRLDRPLSGQRAARCEVLRRVRLAPRFGVEVSMTIDAVRLGYTVEELPVTFSHARTGRNAAGFIHRARQGFDILRALAVCAVRPKRKDKACAPSS